MRVGPASIDMTRVENVIVDSIDLEMKDQLEETTVR